MSEKNTETTETMKEKLQAAGKKAEKDSAQRRATAVKGSHLLPALREAAEKASLKIEEKSGFLKITGAAKGRTVYVARKGGRVDLSGFTVDQPAVRQVSEDEAKEKHLGKVRGQLDFQNATDEAIMKAYGAALVVLGEATPEAPKAEKPAKEPKAPKAAKSKSEKAPAQAEAPAEGDAPKAE